MLVADANPLSPLVAFNHRPQLRTMRNYVRLLGVGGFRELRLHALLPNHTEPFFVVPLDTPAPLTYVLAQILRQSEVGAQLKARGLDALNPLLWPARWAASTALLRMVTAALVPGFAIVGRR